MITKGALEKSRGEKVCFPDCTNNNNNINNNSSPLSRFESHENLS